MDTGWGYYQDSQTNSWEESSSSSSTGNKTHNESTNYNSSWWYDWGKRNWSYDSYAYDYNSYFGNIYGDAHKSLRRILDVLTLVAIATTGATLLIVIVHRRLHRQHHLFSANITLAGLLTACSIGLRIVIPKDEQEYPFFCKLLVYTPCFSALVSNISILMVSVYQLINIRIDPFGSRGIVTTPRCVAATILSWSVVGAPGISGILFCQTSLFWLLLTTVSISTTTFTGCSYFLIYRSVAGAPSASMGSKQREEENSRILQTIALVYGANFLLAIFPAAYWVMLVLSRDWGPLLYLSTLSSLLSSVVNSMVYWWRMKDLQELLPRCKRNHQVEPAVGQNLKTENMVLDNIE